MTQFESDRAVTESKLSKGKSPFKICGLSKWWGYSLRWELRKRNKCDGGDKALFGTVEFEVLEGGPRRASGAQERDWAGNAGLGADGVPTAAEAKGWLYLPRKSRRQGEEKAGKGWVKKEDLGMKAEKD